MSSCASSYRTTIWAGSTCGRPKPLALSVDDGTPRRPPRLIIEAPPRHGKSTQASRLLPAYLLGRNPDLEVLGTSYGDTLAYEFCADVQRIVDAFHVKLLRLTHPPRF